MIAPAPLLRRETLASLLLRRLRDGADRIAFREADGDGVFHSCTFGRWLERSLALSRALIELGVGPQTRVAVIGENSLRWVEADAAVLLAGGTTVTLHPAVGSRTLDSMLNDAEPEIVFRDPGIDAPALTRSRRVFELSGEGAGSLGELVALGQGLLAADRGDVAEARAHSISPTDIATIAYTAGSDGEPKGVQLTHDNLVAQVDALRRALPLRVTDQQLLYLPLAHALGRITVFLQVRVGFSTAFARSPETVLSDCATLSPTVLVSVPRLYEVIAAEVTSRVQGPVAGGALRFALRTGEAIARRRAEGRRLGPLLDLRRRYADRLLFSELRARFGGRMRLLLSGAGALDAPTPALFRAAGLPILEGYGLTETSGPVSLNTPASSRPGTVGRVLASVEARTDSAGEIWVRGPSVTPGYYRLGPGDRDGEWLRTGDLGRFDPDGYLTLTGRTNDILMTSNGRAIAPKSLEAQLEVSPLVAHAVVVAEGRPYPVVLVGLELNELRSWARARGLSADPKSLVSHPTVRNAVQELIDEVNARRPTYEAIVAFDILDGGLDADAGELTATGGKRRPTILDNRRSQIEALYR